MDALRRSVLREMELAREDFAKTTKRERRGGVVAKSEVKERKGTSPNAWRR